MSVAFDEPRSPARPKEREIEAAWRKHEPARAKIPFAARRDAAKFKASIANDAERIKAALKDTALPLINDWAKRGSLSRDRKLARIKEALSGASVDDAGGSLLVLWPELHGQMVMADHPSFKQNCILIVGARGERLRGNIRWSSFLALEVPDHALGRLFQHAPAINASAAIYEAAHAFLAADRRAVEVARTKGATVHLPCGGGLLLCYIMLGPDLEGTIRCLARANTWISLETAEDDQRPVARAADPSASILAAVAR